MKSILVINGHPRAGSFCDALEEAYVEQFGSTNQSIQVLRLRDLNFDLSLSRPREQSGKGLEEDLIKAQELITRADHLVWIYPNWWGTFPALVTGFIDRTFIPGFAFKYQQTSPFPEKLLQGKTARVLVTMDGPGWWYRFAMGAGGDRAMNRSTLKFSGIKVLGIHHFGDLRGKKISPAAKHLERVGSIGKKDRRMSRFLQD